MTARLPQDGETDWGKTLNKYLSEAHNPDGTLVTTPINPYHGGPNQNLANSSRPGIVQLANDLAGAAGAPRVTGLQGKPVSSTQPQDNQALIWDEASGTWVPKTIAGGNEASHARALTINSVGL